MPKRGLAALAITTVALILLLSFKTPDEVPLDRTLGKGVAGEDVLAVQQRLTELGFDPGPADGYYGDLTIRSVWAFEALVMETPADQLKRIEKLIAEGGG